MLDRMASTATFDHDSATRTTVAPPMLGLLVRFRRGTLDRALAAARPFIANLVERLDTIEHPRAAGVARTRLLLTDGSSPVYAPSDPGALARLAWRAADAL